MVIREQLPASPVMKLPQEIRMVVLERPTVETRVLDIRDPSAIAQAVEIIKQGGPVGFAGASIYGLGGTSEVFNSLHDKQRAKEINPYRGRTIAEMKERDFSKSPPVATTSWGMLEDLTDWAEISGPNLGVAEKEVVDFVKNVYHQLPIILILPVKPEAKRMLPFAIETQDGILSHAFMLSGVYSPLISLAEEVEKATGKVFFVTSANPHNKPTYATAEQVAQNLPLPLVLQDPEFDTLAQAQDLYSHTLYDFLHFPEKIGVRRLGNEAHNLLVQMILEAGFRPTFDFSNLDNILPKERPPFGSFETLKKFFG